MKLFSCPVCTQTVFFENTLCLQCGHELAYVPTAHTMVAVKGTGDSDVFTSISPLDGLPRLRHCEHRRANQACNWAMPEGTDDTLCPSCQLTEVIPDLGDPDAKQAWIRAEVAKRRLLYTLDALGLPIEKRDEENRRPGFGFAFLMPGKDGPPVMTGHANGLITLNLVEADDVARTRNRIELGETYRTLLGHFRHEVGHYYWDRLVRDTRWLEGFRRLFGDDRADYGASLEKHYKDGPPPDWSSRHVSAYASAHPWEDWAETWAHYLHLFDTLEIARSYGLALRPVTGDGEVAKALVVRRSGYASFDQMIQSWIPVTLALNSFSRGLGRNDLYPFSLSAPVVEKLRFVHDLIQDAGESPAAEAGLK